MKYLVADFSHWDAFDAQALVQQGIKAVWLKATQGSTFVDSTFVSRVAAAKQAGLYVGAYHFADATTFQAQALHFMSVAGGASRLALDLEPNGVGDTVTGPIAASLASTVAMMSGKRPVIYTGRYGPSGTGREYPNPVLRRCPLWLAEYTSASVPKLPAGWSTWTFWQTTETPTDLDAFNGTEDELSAFFS